MVDDCCPQGFRTGHLYHEPLVQRKDRRERVNADVEVPPSASSFTYFWDEDGKWVAAGRDGQIEGCWGLYHLSRYRDSHSKDKTVIPSCCVSGKLWYLQHNCVGDTIVYH